MLNLQGPHLIIVLMSSHVNVIIKTGKQELDLLLIYDDTDNFLLTTPRLAVIKGQNMNSYLEARSLLDFKVINYP